MSVGRFARGWVSSERERESRREREREGLARYENAFIEAFTKGAGLDSLVMACFGLMGSCTFHLRYLLIVVHSTVFH